MDTASWLSQDVVLDAFKRSEAVTYGVRTGGRPTLAQYVQLSYAARLRPRAKRARAEQPLLSDFLSESARLTGGRVLEAGSSDRLKKTFLEILDEFKNRYQLSYYLTSGKPGWHRLEVRLRDKKGEVTSRRGYEALPAR